MSQGQEFLNNHVELIPVNFSQQGRHEMREEVVSSGGVQDIATRGYPMSDLDDVKFQCGNDQLDVDAVFRSSIDTPFSPSTFNDFEMSAKTENPILIDEEQDKKNFPPPTHPTTPASERPTQPSLLMRGRPFGIKIESVTDCGYGNLFECFLILILCMYSNINCN